MTCKDPHDPPACSLLSLWPPSLQLIISLSVHTEHTCLPPIMQNTNTPSLSSAVCFTSPRKREQTLAVAGHLTTTEPALLPLVLSGLKISPDVKWGPSWLIAHHQITKLGAWTQHGAISLHLRRHNQRVLFAGPCPSWLRLSARCWNLLKVVLFISYDDPKTFYGVFVTRIEMLQIPLALRGLAFKIPVISALPACTACVVAFLARCCTNTLISTYIQYIWG